jgi:hypothetical protein
MRHRASRASRAPACASPSTALSGVRISWLMFARKSLARNAHLREPPRLGERRLARLLGQLAVGDVARVIGGGVMGSGIAAHLANAGCRVLLLDIVPPNLSDDEKKDKKARDRFAQGGLDKALKSRPAAFFHASFANSVRIGNTEDDLEKAQRLRPRHRGDHREARAEAGALRRSWRRSSPRTRSWPRTRRACASRR